MKLVLSLCVFVSLCVDVWSDDWAVIVAGSNGYDNYRHQADACHAFQVVSKGGIAHDHIIMMYYNDIASSTNNPYLGQIFNHPTLKGTPGINVYHGCQKDYTGSQVTAQNFLNVITGNATAMQGIGSGKVLKSGPKDRVFLNFVDHGATGLLAFPTGSYLYAQQLNAALQTMHAKKMYEKLVFYVEACESGSMFANSLPANINIYATTAANPTESSWGTFCPPQDKVNGKNMGTCLGDTYSVNWMQDADRVSKLSKNQTLQVQFNIVKKETTQSHVTQYGDENWTNMPINDFEGQPKAFFSLPQAVGVSRARLSAIHVRPGIVEDGAEEVDEVEHNLIESSSVDSRDIPLHLAYYRYLRADKTNFEESHALATQLQGMITRRLSADINFLAIAIGAVGDHEKARTLFHAPASTTELAPLTCMEPAITAYETRCGRLDDYSLQYVRVISNLCFVLPVEEIITSIQSLQCARSN